KMAGYWVDAPMPAAQEKHSKPAPLKLVTPPKPRQRPTGTSASSSISSASLASASVAGQLIRSVPSIVVMAAPESRLVQKVPSLSLRSLNSGLVPRRSSSALLGVAMRSFSLSESRRGDASLGQVHVSNEREGRAKRSRVGAGLHGFSRQVSAEGARTWDRSEQ